MSDLCQPILKRYKNRVELTNIQEKNMSKNKLLKFQVNHLFFHPKNFHIRRY